MSAKRILILTAVLLITYAVTGAQVQRRTPAVCMPDSESVAAAAPDATVVGAAIDRLSWLAGVWATATGSEERWTPAAGGSMFGVSRTLRNNVLTEFEFLCIVQRGGGLVYQAMPNGRSPATDFTMTRIEANSVTFENPAHDFPKSIRYALRADGGLEAVVSGAPGGRSITFTFKRATEVR
jgi:uncharacterized protein DUF6265